jgi:hypothetical protein
MHCDTDEGEYTELCKFIAEALGPKRCEQVVLTTKPIEQPCLVTTPENESLMRTYGAMNRELTEEQKIMMMRPKLMLNPK